MAANPARKTRPADRPYEVWARGDWTWKVLKKYKNPESEAKDPFALWFCAVQSPGTMGGWDMGDVYARDVRSMAYKVSEDYDD